MGVSGIGDEQDQFYLLKKDSQRRITLCKVLGQDGNKICFQWMKNITRDMGTTLLTMVNYFLSFGHLQCIHLK